MNVQSIIDQIKRVYETSLKTPQRNIPAFLKVCSFMERPGLSLIRQMGRVSQKLSENGIDTGTNRDGTKNMTMEIAKIILDEVNYSLMHEIKIQGAIMPGTLNLLGPVVMTPSGEAMANLTNINGGDVLCTGS